MMDRHRPTTDADPRAVIAAALARIEAAARLTFADARAEEEARQYIAQGMRAICYHARRASWRARGGSAVRVGDEHAGG
jgi:hypothetical protein